MGIRTSFTCDISGRETDKADDVVVFTVKRGNEFTTCVVMEDLVTEAIEDGDEDLLSKIVFRDE